jgi:ribose transport system ATP-binding protein
LNSEYLLEIKNITKEFSGIKALNNVQLQVKKGEIHAICGENGAGKSTLMNIIGGVFPPTEGELIFEGNRISFRTPRDAQNAGIGFVHQELSLCPHLTVAENIFIGRLPKKFDTINFKKLYKSADEVLGRFNANFSSKKVVSDLTVSEQQLIEIGKTISQNCKLLILDEPTSSLTDKETDKLFEVIRDLSANGISIVFITHRMSEIFRLCDRVTVLKDGTFITTKKIDETSVDDVIRDMIGRDLNQLYPDKDKSVKQSKEILRVENLYGTKFTDINFSLYEGEILGFAGLVGAGRSEIMQVLCGLDIANSGAVYINGKRKLFKKYRDAVKNGICYLTEDRKRYGIFPQMNIMDNMASANLKAVSRGIWFDKNLGKSLVKKFIDQLNIKISDINYQITSLSGGNQQKCLVGKWLSVNPAVLILDEPTRGIDVGSKAEIHYLLRRLASEGVGIIIVSSELPEAIGVCDRVAVIHEGKLMGILTDKMITEENIMMMAAGKTMVSGVSK